MQVEAIGDKRIAGVLTGQVQRPQRHRYLAGQLEAVGGPRSRIKLRKVDEASPHQNVQVPEELGRSFDQCTRRVDVVGVRALTVDAVSQLAVTVCDQLI